MKTLRALLRLALASLSSLVHLVVLVVGGVFLLPFPRARSGWRMFVFRSWSRSLLPVLGVELEVEGTPPEPPFFLVSNHLSYLDIPVLGSQQGAIFVAKSEIAGWPGIGLMCKAINTIFIDRQRLRDLPRVMDAIDREIDHGMGVILFAEGTSSKGATVLPFRPSLLEAAARADRRVAYATLTYCTEPDDPPAHLSVCWWGGMEFSPHSVDLAKLRRVRAKVVFGDRLIHDCDRKQLAEKLHAAVAGQFEPVVNEEEE